jgi:hypothetical protein
MSKNVFVFADPQFIQQQIMFMDVYFHVMSVDVPDFTTSLDYLAVQGFDAAVASNPELIQYNLIDNISLMYSRCKVGDVVNEVNNQEELIKLRRILRDNAVDIRQHLTELLKLAEVGDEVEFLKYLRLPVKTHRS